MTGGRDAKKAAAVPHRFFYRKYKDEDLVVVPRTSSGRRNYLPCVFLKKGTIVSNQAFVIYGATPVIFGMLSSRLHCLWMSITSGKMRHDYSYSVNLTYNTFPFPKLTDKQEATITSAVFSVLSEREAYPDITLSKLYDPIDMPKSLKAAHDALDSALEKCYSPKKLLTDEDRIEVLFKAYERIKEGQKCLI